MTMKRHNSAATAAQSGRLRLPNTRSRTRRRLIGALISSVLLPALVAGGASAQAPVIPKISIPTISLPPGITLPPLELIYVDDVRVTVSDGLTTVEPNAPVVTKITVTNRSSASVSGIGVLYSPPPSLTGAIWACTVPATGSCGGGTTGSGAISRSIALPKGGSAIFTVSAAVSPTATGTITSKATAVPPASLGDTIAANNEATDTTTITLPVVATTSTVAPTTTGAATTTSTIAVVPASTVAPVTTAAPATTAAPVTTAVATTAPSAGAANGFQSPTGGIQCRYFDDTSAGGTRMRCYVANSTAKLPKQPATCDFDWEDAGLNASGKYYTVCAGDTIEGTYPVLAYGATWKRGVFTCTSAKAGITCRNASRKGFRLSRAKRTAV